MCIIQKTEHLYPEVSFIQRIYMIGQNLSFTSQRNPNKGRYGANDSVPCREVVPILEVK